MFWQSVRDGLAMSVNAHVLGATIVTLLLVALPDVIGFLVTAITPRSPTSEANENSDSSLTADKGTTGSSILLAGGCLPLLAAMGLRSIAVPTWVIYVTPLALGAQQPTAVGAILGEPGTLVVSTVLAFVVVVATSVVPLVGAIVRNFPPAALFLQTIVVFRWIYGETISNITREAGRLTSPYPSIFESVGFGAISTVAFFTAAIPLHLALKLFVPKRVAEVMEDLLLPSIGSVAFLLPTLMYIAHVSLCLRG